MHKGRFYGGRITGTLRPTPLSWLPVLCNIAPPHIRRKVLTANLVDKPVGDWISAPSQNLVAVATRVGPTTFCMVTLNRPSRNPPSRPKHLRSICHTSRVIGDFCSNFGESILGVRGPKSKIEEQRFVECHMEN